MSEIEQKALGNEGLLYFWQGISGKLDTKVDKVSNMGLSTNDFTTAEKEKLAAIAEGATNIVVEDILTSTNISSALSANQGRVLNERIDSLIDNMSSLGYGDMMKATYDADGDGKVDKALHADEAANALKFGGQEPAYYAKAADIPNISGKLDKNGDGSNVTATFTQANERANIVTGEKLTIIFSKIAKYFADFKTVAFTGSYSDLIGKPTIPTVTNDLTNELKANYDAAYTHSQTAHAPANAQANVIETINVNGTAQTPVDKAVSITVPTTVTQLTDAGNYALKTDLTNVYQYAGSVATVDDLPLDLGVIEGTVPVYNVEDTGMNYAWNGTEWDNLGTIFSIDYITNSEIDAILAS